MLRSRAFPGPSKPWGLVTSGQEEGTAPTFHGGMSVWAGQIGRAKLGTIKLLMNKLYEQIQLPRRSLKRQLLTWLPCSPIPHMVGVAHLGGSLAKV